MNQESEVSDKNLAALYEQQSILAKFGLEALKVKEIGDLLQLASELAAQGLESGFAKILKYLPEEQKFLIVAGVGWSQGVVGIAKMESGRDSAPGFAFHSDQPVLTGDLNEEERFRVPPLLRDNQVRSAVNVIIRAGDERWGVLEADSREVDAFTPESVDFLHGFSNILGIALSRLKSEERFRLFADFTYDWEYWIAPDGSYVYISPACEKVTGYPPENFRDPGRDLELVHPEDRDSFAEHLREHLSESTQNFELEVRIINRLGEVRWLSHACRPVYDRDGRYRGRRASNRDITKRKEAEHRMKLFIHLVNQANDGLMVVDLQTGRIAAVNEKLGRDLQYTKEELLGMRPELISSKPAGFFERHFSELREAGTWLEEDYHRRKDGTTFPVEINVKYTRVDHQEFAVAGIRDISVRRRMEQELQKAQKLESIGLLAGGIAHDFNNILTAILGNITLARILPAEQAAEKLAIAEQATIRASGLSQQLLTFARGGAPIKKTISVPQLVREAAGLALRGSRVREEYEFGAGLWLVEADENQMNQAINNLALNAVEAMPAGGVLTIRAANESLERDNTMGLPPGKYVRIAVEDQGAGIPKEKQAKIFDPYFTTKEGGSGLGLTTSFSIIKRHGGTITVDSTPGKGSTFSIYLPASEEKVPTAGEQPPEERVAGTGRILVMDDEEEVAAVAAEMLRLLGYRAETAVNGSEALLAYREALAEGDPFDAVITDLTVPAAIGGKETGRQLLELDPRAKIIVSSGYGNDPIMSDYAEYGFKGVIPKPYKLAELGKTLEEVVGGRGK